VGLDDATAKVAEPRVVDGIDLGTERVLELCPPGW
jgi:hypothetical protein